MLDNYKIVCNTAAGRRRYMQYLVPFIVASDIVDRYDIWVNTVNKQDMEFFQILSEKFPKINLVYQPDGIVKGNSSINAFYRQCIEEDTVYFKLDDDIIWMEPGLIEKMARFRIDHPDYFIVSPLVINNAICTYIMQNAGKIKLNRYYPPECSENILVGGPFAAQLHEWFLTTQLPDSRYQNLYCGKRPIAMNRFSINAILWFGREMKKFGGVVPGDDEEWLSVIKPTELGTVNCINGNAIVAHFAFFTQREELDKLDILSRYGAFLHKEWERNDKMAEIGKSVLSAMHESDALDFGPVSRRTIKQKIRSLIGKIKVPVVKFDSLSKIREKRMQKEVVKKFIP